VPMLSGACQILEHAPYNELADIYSFGVFIWELVTRETPFDGMSGGKIVSAVLDNQRYDEWRRVHAVDWTCARVEGVVMSVVLRAGWRCRESVWRRWAT
jgi:serine/threonine protein kinase